jgi:hypothetical protein
VFRRLLEVALADQIDDQLSVLRIISRLIPSRKLFLLRNISFVFSTFPHYVRDSDFRDLYRLIVSAPLHELITQSECIRQVHMNYNTVLRYLLDAVAIAPMRIETWLIDGRDLSWEQVVTHLCSVGFSAFAAELGSMAIDREQRHRILCDLVEKGYFDDAIKFGFSQDSIFGQIIRDGRIEHATEVLIDAHFDLFVDWLAARKDVESIAHVTAALKDQGRTLEAKKVSERFAAKTKE